MSSLLARLDSYAFALLAVGILFLQPVRGEEPAAAPRTAVVLTDAPPGQGVSGGILIRELVRQALLMTARDEFGLLTRDTTLGEVLAEKSKLATAPLQIQVAAKPPEQGPVSVCISIQKPDGIAELTTFKLTADDAAAIPQLTAQLEKMSRNELVKVLEDAGHKRQTLIQPAAKPDAPATVPDKIAKQLSVMSPIVQFAGIQAIHDAIHKTGETEPLLAALARAYANLGILTELNWSPAHKVFKARALLYAERLQAKSPGKNSLSTRAYVRALIGLQSQALEDLASLTELAEKQQPSEGLSSENDLIVAFCNGDLETLSEAGKEGDLKLLTALLRLLIVEGAEIPALRISAAEAVLAIDRTNVRASQSLATQAPLGLLRMEAVNAPQRFYSAVALEVAEIADIPTRISDIIKAPQEQDASPIPRVVELMQALLRNEDGDAAENTRQEDLSELSLAVAGNLIREINFGHAWNLMHLQRNFLAVNADSSLLETQPLVDGHRYQMFIECHAWSPQQARKAMEALANILNVDPHLEASGDPMFVLLKQQRLPRADQWRASSGEHNDIVLRDLLDTCRRNPYEPGRAIAASLLGEVNPMSPVVIAATLAHAFNTVEGDVDSFEKDFPKDPIVQDMLAKRYSQVNKNEAAIRCLQRRIDVLPDAESYNRLAALNQALGNEDGWVKSLTESLKLQDRGLEGAGTRVKLAKYFAKKKDLQTACEYAAQAAKTGAAWAYLCAADCYELKQDWESAEENIRAVSQRYPGEELRWYLWCRSTGKGDLSAARQFAKQALPQFMKSREPDRQIQAALYHYSEEDDEQALQILQDHFASNPSEFTGVFAALLADELGNAELRNQLLERAQKIANVRMNNLGTTIIEFRNALRSKDPIPFDPKISVVGAHLQPNGGGTLRLFFVGKFLQMGDQKAAGLNYLQLAATSPTAAYSANYWAGITLARQEVERAPLRASEWAGDGEFDRVYELLVRATVMGSTGDVQSALPLIDLALEIDPKSAEALFARVSLYQAAKQYDKAVIDLTKLKDLLPKSTDVLFELGKFHELLGNYPAAIAEYEQAIKLNPYQGNGFKAIAHLLATCDDAKIREGKQAVEYAQRALTMQDSVPEGQKRATLAMALAEAGDFTEAIKQAELLLKAAPPQFRNEFAPVLELFRQGKPFHRSSLKKAKE